MTRWLTVITLEKRESIGEVRAQLASNRRHGGQSGLQDVDSASEDDEHGEFIDTERPLVIVGNLLSRSRPRFRIPDSDDRSCGCLGNRRHVAIIDSGNRTAQANGNVDVGSPIRKSNSDGRHSISHRDGRSASSIWVSNGWRVVAPLRGPA